MERLKDNEKPQTAYHTKETKSKTPTVANIIFEFISVLHMFREPLLNASFKATAAVHIATENFENELKKNLKR